MQPTKFHIASTTYRSILPVPPSVGPTISLELDVEDGEVENYEVRESASRMLSECILFLMVAHVS